MTPPESLTGLVATMTPTQVHQHRAQIRSGSVQAPKHRLNTAQRLLSQVLSRGAITGQQERQPSATIELPTEPTLQIGGPCLHRRLADHPFTNHQ
jgi:hypothetical protein